MRGLGRSLWPSNRATRMCTRVNSPLSPLFSSSSVSSSPSASPSSSTSSSSFSSVSSSSLSSTNFSVKHVPFQPSANGHTPHSDDATLEQNNENNENNGNNDNIENNFENNGNNENAEENNITEDTYNLNNNNTSEHNNNNNNNNNTEEDSNNFAQPNGSIIINKNKLEGTRNLSPEAEEKRSKALRYLESLENMQVNRGRVDINYLLNTPNLSISHLDRIMVIGKMYNSVDLYEYGTYLTIVAKRGDLERVLGIFKEMTTRNIAPDSRCLNALMSACAAHDKLDVMLTLSRSRNSEWPPEFRSDPFGAIVAYYIQKDSLDKALETVEEVIEKGLRVNACVANPILGYLARKLQPKLDDTGRKVFSLKPEEETEIRRKFNLVLDKMQLTNGVPDSMTYLHRMQALKSGKIEEEGNKLLDEAREFGIPLDSKIYNVLINSLASSGDIDSATRILVRMNAEEALPDNATYSILVSAFVKSRALGALQALVPLITRPENKPMLWVYSNLVDALYKLGDVESSNAVLDYMRQLGLKADVYTYNAILYRYHRTENRQVCVAIYDEMINAGVLPDRATYDIMFHAYSTMGDIPKSREMFDALLSMCKPQSTVFFAMARLYLHENDYKSCLSILSLAKQHGFSTHPTTTRIELLAFAGAHDLNGVVKCFNFAKKDGGPITLTALAAYMSTNVRHKQDVCEECLEEARRLSVVFKPWHYQMMLEFLAKSQKWDSYNKVAADYKANYKNSADYTEPDKEVEQAKLSRITLPRKPYKSNRNPSSAPNSSSSNSSNFVSPNNSPSSISPSPRSSTSPSSSFVPSSPSHSSSPSSSSPPPSSSSSPSLSSPSSSSSSLSPPPINSQVPQNQKKNRQRKNKTNPSPVSSSSSSSPPPSLPPQGIPDFTQYQFDLFQQHYLPFQQYLSHLQQQQNQLQQQQFQQQQTHLLHSIFLQKSQEKQTTETNETNKETETKKRVPLTLANLQVQTHHSKLVGTAYNVLLQDACLRGDLTRLGYILYYMASAGLKVDGQAYSGLLAAALTHGDDGLASQVLSSMEAQGISADTHLYNVILACWNDRGEYTKIEALVQHMHNSAIPQDDTTRQIIAQFEENRGYNNNNNNNYNNNNYNNNNNNNENNNTGQEMHTEAQ